MPAQGRGEQNGHEEVPPASPAVNRRSLASAIVSDEDLGGRQFWQLCRRRWWAIGAIALAVMGAGTAYTLDLVKVYQGQFQLLVEPVEQADKAAQSSDKVDGDTKSNSGLDYDTQIEVLSSQKILLPILAKINHNCRVNLNYESLLNGLKIERKRGTKILETSYRDSDPQKITCILEELSQGYIAYSQQAPQGNILPRIRFADKQLTETQARVDKLQAQLQSFRQKYNVLDPQTQAQQLTERLTAVESQRVETSVRLNEYRSLYQALQAQLGVSPDRAIALSALSQSPRYQRLLDQLQELETQLAAELARFNENSPTIQSLREKQRNLLVVLQQEANRVGVSDLKTATNSPQGDPTSPNAIRSNLTQQLVESANQIKVLEARLGGIERIQRALQQQIQQIPPIARQYADLQRELTVAAESLERFVKIKENLQIEAAQKDAPWQLLAPPTLQNQPVSPNIPLNAILAATTGLMLGLGAALVLDKLDNVFHRLDELKDRTKLPLLGIIPYHQELVKSVTAKRSKSRHLPSREREESGGWLSQTVRDNRKRSPWLPNSPFLAAFAELQTNISFLSSDSPVKSIVISSATPGDGKSTISCNLARVAAALGKRVVLVDANMRDPQVHEMLELENIRGLSNLLVTETPAYEVIQLLPKCNNLHVITAGNPLPPDPTRLLGSQKMHQLMQQLEAQFDLAIYDTPSLVGLADGRLLVPHTAGLILAVKLGKTTRESVKEVLNLVQLSSGNVLGIVANAVKDKGNSDRDLYWSQPGRDAQIEITKQLLQKSLDKEDKN